MPTELNGVPVKLFAAQTLLPANRLRGYGRTRSQQVVAQQLGRIRRRHTSISAATLSSCRWRWPRADAEFPYVLQTHGMVVPSNHPLAAPLDAVWTRRVLRDAGAVFYLNPQERGQLVAVAGPSLRLVRTRQRCAATTPRRAASRTDRRFCSPPGCIRGNVRSRSSRWRRNCSTPVSTRDSRW